MRSTRRKHTLLALPAVAALTLSMFAGVAGAQTIIEQGSSDDLVAPPSPECPADAITLIPEVQFTSAGVPIDAAVLGVGNGLASSIEIENFTAVDAGAIEIVEIITYDAHTGRVLWPTQDNESVAIEFLLDGNVEATTEFTPDVEDGVNSAWVVASLTEVELPNGADAARVVHFNEENNNDSVIVASACAMFTAADSGAEETPTLDELIQQSTETQVLGETVEAEEAVEEEAVTEEETEEPVEEEADDDDLLAMTGANEIALAIVALGILMFGVAFKIQSQDPDELRPL